MFLDPQPVLHRYTSLESIGVLAPEALQVNAVGILENVDAAAVVPLQDVAYDVEAQDPIGPPSPTRSLTSSEICLPGSLHQVDQMGCTDEQIVLVAFCSACVVVGFMFVYWSYRDE